ncbi:SusC/RagA family TonB-linked outer membrane protein [Pedobacter cryoconitis]|uniref:TonB-linked SusC/RagA family outer membrane protein n=1 Tax=Pedobacter cryoconitis TaxID=188932 RepID=A0A327SI47_9SPHI|nr:SusC/RagA family TonB-linked outer membrane protein [Pedobacter cryoconitis]RAJ25427.1 TonB-linked SusC/RagA family outer membrane protein [Pedobacter cryoconitis]
MNLILQDRIGLFKIMKVTLSQLAIVLALSGASYAENSKAQDVVLDRSINISVKNRSLETVLKKVTSITSVKFIYSKDFVNTDAVVSVDAKNKSLRNILNDLLTKYNIRYEIINGDILLEVQPAQSSSSEKQDGPNQQQLISGVVTSNTGESLPGVSVFIKGTKQGTNTDGSGKYVIKVPDANSILVFEYMGYVHKEVPVSGKSVVNVILTEDAHQLGEVVVTALGIKRSAKELGYATQQVNAKDLTQSRPTNLAAGLSGKVAGLQIVQTNNQIDAGDQIRVVLRGNRSFQGSNQALLVLDGVVVPLSYLNSINPNDVDNVNILKGANAAALYGSEASNGVMIVSTKHGVKDQTQITYTNTTQLNQLAYFPKMQTQFGGGSGQDVYGFPQYTPIENQNFGDRFDGSLRPIGRTLPDGSIQTVPYSNLSDEKKKFFQTGIDEQNDLSYSTGNDKGSTYINVQRVNSKGYVPGDFANRTAARFNGTRIYNKLKIDYTLNYTQKNYDKSYAQIYNNIINTPANIPLTQYKDINSTYGNLDNYFNDYGLNPYFYLQQQRNNERRDDLLGNLSLSYDVAPWLNLTARAGITTYTKNGKFIKKAVNYSDFAHDSGKSIANPQSSPATESDYSNFNSRMEGNFMATFKKKVSDFNFTLIAGTQTIQKSIRDLSAGTDFLVIPDFYNVGYRAGDANVSETSRKDRQLAAFGDLTVGYKDYLFLHASGRNDWDSRLAPENRSFFYPSADLSFVFTDAFKSLKESKILSYGKIRGGIAKVYAVQFDPYSLEATFDVGSGFPYGSTAGYSVGGTVYAPGLKPEQTVSTEIGLELGFFNNRITMETSAYWETTKDQEILKGINISSATGFTNAIINTGSGKNKGIELSMKGSPFVSQNGRGVTWNLGVNYSYNTNKAVELYQGLPNLSIGNNNYIVKDQPYPVLMGNGFATDPQGRTIVDPGTGFPKLSQTNILFGQTTPKNILGISSSLSYHNFTLSGTAEYRSGSVVYSGAGSTMDFSGISYGSATNGRERFVYPNSVIETSPGVFIPNTNITTRTGGIDYWAGSTTRYDVMQNYVTSAAFWKIRELSIGYELPAKLLERTHFIKRANFALVGRNLFMFRPKSNMYSDPEYNATTDNAQGYNNLNQTPPTRIYGFTATITL